MSTKKKTATTKTASQPKPKYYIVMDSDQDIVCQGEWWEVKDALDEYMEGNDDKDNIDMLSDFTLYELSVGKKLKYIPHVPASVEM